jgi:hypothetical protein
MAGEAQDTVRNATRKGSLAGRFPPGAQHKRYAILGACVESTEDHHDHCETARAQARAALALGVRYFGLFPGFGTALAALATFRRNFRAC